VNLGLLFFFGFRSLCICEFGAAMFCNFQLWYLVAYHYGYTSLPVSSSVAIYTHCVVAFVVYFLESSAALFVLANLGRYVYFSRFGPLRLGYAI